MQTVTAAGPDLRLLARADLSRATHHLGEVERHTRECKECGPECVAWLRDQWATINEALSGAKFSTLSIARHETLTLERGAD